MRAVRFINYSLHSWEWTHISFPPRDCQLLCGAGVGSKEGGEDYRGSSTD